MAKKQDIRIWTPVANALEAYRRRLIADPRAVYEHIWRLVHIEESLIVTLGSALAARLCSLWYESGDSQFSRLRNAVTGTADDEDEEAESSTHSRACLRGSIDAWNSLLNDFGKLEATPNCEFYKALSEYLFFETEEPILFLDPWQRIGPVPEVFRGKQTRIGRLKAINSLRNKLAHVPVSEKVLDRLHEQLKREVLTLLSPTESLRAIGPKDDVTETNWHAPLRGRIRNDRGWVTGSSYGPHDANGETVDQEARFAWRPMDGEEITWPASPFVVIDPELKVLLLFRLDDVAEGLEADSDFLNGEYYRFAAEIEPVQKLRVEAALLKPWLPPRVSPAVATQGAASNGDLGPQVEPATLPIPTGPTNAPVTQASRGEELGVSLEDMSSDDLRSEGERAFKRRDFPRAVTIFDELRTRNERYNDVTKLRHGEAMWKAAVDQSAGNATTRKKLEAAIDLLREAAGHRDPRYAAKAHYQMSKAYRRLFQLSQAANDRNSAIQAASEAAKLAYEPQYIEWYERLNDEIGEQTAKN